MAEKLPTDALILGMAVLARVADTDHPDHNGVRLAEPARFVFHSVRAIVLHKEWLSNGKLTVRLVIADPTTTSGTRECLTHPLDAHRLWRLDRKTS